MWFGAILVCAGGVTDDCQHFTGSRFFDTREECMAVNEVNGRNFFENSVRPANPDAILVSMQCFTWGEPA